ncbi:hypothetical protein HY486_00895 [Candidatus Woesearchaeota archaeon]|nr:hypothetical protein [Candidatus Woesearchaeota archaeon]
MAGLEVVGIALVAVSIVYSFYKKHDRTGMALIIVLLVLLSLLGYLN